MRRRERGSTTFAEDGSGEWLEPPPARSRTASFALAGVAIACAVSTGACGSSAPHDVHPVAHASAATSVASAAPPAPPPPRCDVEPSKVLSPEIAARRSDAVRALLEGRTHLAVRGFVDTLAARPIDVGSYALLTAAHARATADWGNASRTLEGAKARVLAVDPRGAEQRSALAVGGADAAFTLGAPVVRAFDDGEADAWFVRHDVEMPGAPDDDESAFGLTVEGQPLTRAFHGADHDVFVFGTEIVGLRANDVDAITLFRLAPEGAPGTTYRVIAAAAASDALVVTLQRADAAPDGKPDDFLVALDAATGDVHWVSEPGTASADSFVLAGHRAIVGARAAGGTGELHVVDLATGRIVARTPLAFEPQRVFANDGRLVVLGASHEAILSVEPALPPPPPFTGGRATRPLADIAADRCAIERALVSLDGRDGHRAASDIASVADDRVPAVRALRAAADFVDRSVRDPGSVVDLTERMPIRIAADAPLVPRDKPKPAARVRLTKKATVSLRPPSQKQPLAGRPGPTAVPAPAEQPPLQSPPPLEPVQSPTFEIPDAFGTDSLVRSATYGDASVLVFGDHVAVLAGMKTRNVFDLSALMMGSGGLLPERGANLLDAAVHGDLLLVSVAAQYPGAPPAGVSSYVVAIDVANGGLVWKSPPSAATISFVLDGDTLFTAGGPPDGPWTLYAFHADTGEIVARERLSKAPTQMGFLGDELAILSSDEYTTYAVAGRGKHKPPPPPLQKLDRLQ